VWHRLEFECLVFYVSMLLRRTAVVSFSLVLLVMRSDVLSRNGEAAGQTFRDRRQTSAPPLPDPFILFARFSPHL